jgi:trigger factor
MIETQQRQLVDDFAQRMQMQGLSMEQYYQFTGLDQAKMLEQVKPQAERKIKSRLVLEAVVKAEKIEASEEEYNKELERMAEVYNMEIDKVKEMIAGNEKAIAQIKEDLAITKAVKFVVDEAKEK